MVAATGDPGGRGLLWTGATAIFLTAWVVFPADLPQGPEVIHGTVEHSVAGHAMTILQHTPRSIVHYHSFDIGADHSVTVTQPSSSSAFLASVTGDSR